MRGSSEGKKGPDMGQLFSYNEMLIKPCIKQYFYHLNYFKNKSTRFTKIQSYGKCVLRLFSSTTKGRISKSEKNIIRIISYCSNLLKHIA